MRQFPYVPARDLIRVKVGNSVWYVHKSWIDGNWPRKVGA